MEKKQYNDIYKGLLNYVFNGQESSPRGKLIKEQLLGCFDYDSQQMLAEFEGKEFSFKYLYGELLWYLSGSLHNEFIGKYAKLWTSIQNDSGKLNSNYGNLVFYKHNERGETQYDRALNSLIHDKDSRQAIIHYNQPEHQIPGVKDFPCTLYQQFFIRDNKLVGITNMRSNDLFYGTNYDVVWFGLVMQSLYLDLLEYYPDLKLSEMTHVANSLHIYEKDFDKTVEIMSSKNDINYGVHLKRSIPKIISENNGLDILSREKDISSKQGFIDELDDIGISISII